MLKCILVVFTAQRLHVQCIIVQCVLLKGYRINVYSNNVYYSKVTQRILYNVNQSYAMDNVQHVLLKGCNV